MTAARDPAAGRGRGNPRGGAGVRGDHAEHCRRRCVRTPSRDSLCRAYGAYRSVGSQGRPPLAPVPPDVEGTMRVLVADDERLLADTVAEGLRRLAVAGGGCPPPPAPGGCPGWRWGSTSATTARRPSNGSACTATTSPSSTVTCPGRP